jgi:maltooligosyltrehalose trehalohydrolase
VIGETDQNDARLTERPELGGIGLDAVWSDDLHHSLHAVLTGEREGYYQDFGAFEDVAKAFREVFVYDGNYSRFRRRHFGSPVKHQDRSRFVVCLQNHDQVGNRPAGNRMSTSLPPAACRLGAAVILLSPSIPLLFMGEEYGERRPFPFFCSFADPALIEAVRSGRRREFESMAFAWGDEIPDPQSEATFDSARLSWCWDDGCTAGLRQLYTDLLLARRTWPPLLNRRDVEAVLLSCPGGGQVLQIVRGGEPSVVAFANLAPQPVVCPPSAARHLLLSTEFPLYSGAWQENCGETLLGYEVRILGSERFEPCPPTP